MGKNLQEDEGMLQADCEVMSPAWITAYDKYRQKPPELTSIESL